MGADLSGSTFLKFNFMKKINTRTADFIPSAISATWIFKLRNNEDYQFTSNNKKNVPEPRS